MTINVKFWGVRGSFPCAGPNFQEYGGNTSCVEVRCGDLTIILDAGTGLQRLGESLQSAHALLLLSHTHIDHILGLPFFAPLYRRDFTLDIAAGHLSDPDALQHAIRQVMSPPIFPLTLESCASQKRWHHFTPGQNFTHPKLAEAGVQVQTLALNHPGGATGYRITYQGTSLCYITDIEHTAPTPDKDLLGFVRDTDLLIYDSSYDDDQFDAAKGWGHSTWQQAVRLAQAANARQLALFHHDHLATDALLRTREQEAKKMLPSTFLAKDNLDLSIG